jgi:purine-binding chemotaxis protein CheW
MNQDEKNIILHERATVLAIEKTAAVISQDLFEIIEFIICGEKYGISIEYIKRVVKLRDFITLPGLPQYVLGIMNVHGEIVTLIDLRKLFNLNTTQSEEMSYVIIVQWNDITVGLLCEEISGFVTIQRDEIQSSFLSLAGIKTEYLTGVTEDRIAILNIMTLLYVTILIIQESL